MGMAPVRREEAIMLKHRAGSQCMARGGLAAGRMRGRTRPAENVRRSRLARVLGQGWACGRITQDRKMQHEGLRKR